MRKANLHPEARQQQQLLQRLLQSQRQPRRKLQQKRQRLKKRTKRITIQEMLPWITQEIRMRSARMNFL